MALDQQIKQAIEAATAQLAGQFQERLHTLASELGDAASAEHARDLDEAVSRVRAELTAQHDSALEALKADLASQHASALDALRADLAAKHEAAMEALRAEAAEQRELAISMARTEAEEQRESALASLRADAESRHQSALDAMRADIGAEHAAALAAVRAQLVSGHESDLESLRADLTSQHEAALAAARSELAAARAEADERAARMQAEADERASRLQTDAEQVLAHARTEAEDRLAAAKAEADAALARTLADARAENDRVSRDLVDARASERHVELAFADRLSDAVRRLDGARSLIEVLDVLVDAGSREVPRVAIFLVRGGKLAGWRAAGFSRDNDPRELEVPIDQAGLLTRAVRSSAAVATSDAASGDGGAGPFGVLPGSNAAVAIPLRVGGETVGVLYADDVSARDHDVPSAWPESVEVLARHACRCLEVVTIARVTQPASMPAMPAPTPTPRRLTPQARNFQPGHDDDDDAARRYARLLVSEIKLYHESAVTAGRRDRDLLERLRAEIDRARRLYGERVPAAVQARTDYFDQELVRTLANGDASLLGPA
jgi:hypothetical protein